MPRESSVTLRPEQAAKSGHSWIDVLKLVTTIVASVAIPVVLFIVGKGIEGSVKSKELEAKYVEISVGILTEEPSPEMKNLRKWAIANINTYAEIKLPEEAQTELNTESLPVRSISSRLPAQNYSIPSSPRSVEFLVVTDTENPSLKSALSMLRRADVNTSYHYLIGTDGSIEKLVDEEHIAWHAGRSAWQGKTNLNSISIGIGLVHLATPDGRNWLNLPADHPAVGPDYPKEQIAALLGLLEDLVKRYDLDVSSILTKQDIAPDRRRSDLYGDPIAELRELLSQKLGASS